MLESITSPYLHDTFHYAVNITGHASRNIHRLFVPRVQTTLGPLEWNLDALFTI